MPQASPSTWCILIYVACVFATWMQKLAQAPADWLSCISIICQDWLISPAPIWIHKDIPVGYVCGKAIVLLNQRSHLQSSLMRSLMHCHLQFISDETSRNLWSGITLKQCRQHKTGQPYGRFNISSGVVVHMWHPQKTGNLQTLMALGTRRSLALPHLCTLLPVCTALKSRIVIAAQLCKASLDLCFPHKPDTAGCLLHPLYHLTAVQHIGKDTKPVWDGTFKPLLLF